MSNAIETSSTGRSARAIVRREAPADLQLKMPDDLNPVLKRVYAARGVEPAVLDLSLAAMIPVSRLAGSDAAAERLTVFRLVVRSSDS